MLKLPKTYLKANESSWTCFKNIFQILPKHNHVRAISHTGSFVRVHSVVTAKDDPEQTFAWVKVTLMAKFKNYGHKYIDSYWEKNGKDERDGDMQLGTMSDRSTYKNNLY